MAFIQDGTALAYYYPNFCFENLGHNRSPAHGYELILQGMSDGSGRRATILGPSRAQGRSVRAIAQSGDWGTPNEVNDPELL